MPEIEPLNQNDRIEHDQSGNHLDIDAPGIQCNGPPVLVDSLPVDSGKRTSSRTRRKPAKYDDFVMYK